LPDKNNHDEINIEIASDETQPVSNESFNENKNTTESSEKYTNFTEVQLKELVLEQKRKLSLCEDKLKHSLADFQNLERRTKSSIDVAVNLKIDNFMVKFLNIYDDFVRAKEVMSNEKTNLEGLESILKNMDSFLTEYNVTPIESLGEIFDPNLHEAINVIEDSTLDENTITKEIRKGYISRERVIRPALVEISKKSK